MNTLAEKIDLNDLYETIADIKPIAQEPSMNKVPHNAPVNIASSNPQLTIIADAMKRAEKLFATKNAEYGDKADRSEEHTSELQSH